MRQLAGRIGVFFLLFILLTVPSIKCGSMHDGYDRAGFPFQFYSYACGECVGTGCCIPHWNFLALAGDIGTAVITTGLALLLIKQFRS